MRILFAGGGTGGHFFPIIAAIRELKRIAEERQILDLELYYMSPDSLGEALLKQEKIVHIRVMSGKVRRYFSLKNFSDMFKLGIGIIQATWNMFLIMPDVVFSKGGYGALPAVIASAIFNIPLMIHDSDAIPGRVSVFSARFARRIGIAFPTAEGFFPKDKTALVGIPIRKRILGGNREHAKEELSVYSDLPVVGIIGASQGSEKINDAVLGALKDLTEEFEVIHQTGSDNFTEVKGEAEVITEFAHKERYHPFGFLDEGKLREFYLLSDVVVSRASATTIFEIAAWGKPAILIPLNNSAQDHQKKNAFEYAETGAALVVEEENLTPHILLAEIRKVAMDSERRKKMSEAAQKFARIDSAEIIAKEILNLGVH